MKKCSVCEEVKELSQYRKSKSGKLGLDACCKLCDNKRKLKYHSGVSIKEFDSMLLEQKGKCKICKKELNYSGYRIHVDHNHLTGKIRGILCNNCNLMIGHARDSIETLQLGIEYLKNN